MGRDMGPILDKIALLEEANKLLEAERDRYRQEAKQERELTQDIVGEREELIIENEQLVAFAKRVIQSAFDGGSLDGFDIQELGVKYGLLTEESYDPEKHGDDHLSEFEPGDTIYMHSEILRDNAIESTAIA